MNTAWLKKEITPPSKVEIFYLLSLLILPNLFFLALTYYAGVSRPLFNIDYLITLFFILIPYKVTRILGSFILVLVILMDILMFVIQIFPFMNLSAIRYLSSFILDAPTHYLLISVGVIVAIVAIVGIFVYLSKKIKQPYPSFILIILLICGYVLMRFDISYARFSGILGRDNYYITHSQSALYLEITQSEFSDLMDTKPQLEVLDKNQIRALDSIQQPYASKILFIVAESWGELRDKEAQNTVVEHIFKQKDQLENISLGTFFTIGATVSGELRELCSLKIMNNGFALNQSEPKGFSECFPNQLKHQGYKTIAMHGTSGLLYDRTDWYPKSGFQQTLFGENFMGLKRCAPFKGVCDKELMSVVEQTFKQNTQKPLFFYWMTLTSHQPYAKQDIYNQRFDCKKFAMNPTGDACNNTQLQTQFFDDLAQLIQKPEMRGVEVIVVGDHQPPIWGEDIKYFRPLYVSYLHFKIK